MFEACAGVGLRHSPVANQRSGLSTALRGVFHYTRSHALPYRLDVGNELTVEQAGNEV